MSTLLRRAFLLLVLVGCRGPIHARRPATEDARVREAPAQAAELAREMVHGRTGALIEVNRFRFHPAGEAVGRLGEWGAVVSSLGLDPLMDVQRAFVVADASYATGALVLLELSVSDEVTADALRRARSRGSGTGPTERDLGYPAADVLRDREPALVALVRPGLLVIAPTHLGPRLAELRVPARLPPVARGIAARFFAFDPAQSLSDPPTWPTSVLAAHAELELDARGGAIVRFFAFSTSGPQAQVDAEVITKQARDLLAIDLGLFEMHVLDPPRFLASGRLITMETRLLPDDLDWLLRFTGAS